MTGPRSTVRDHGFGPSPTRKVSRRRRDHALDRRGRDPRGASPRLLPGRARDRVRREVQDEVSQ